MGKKRKMEKGKKRKRERGRIEKSKGGTAVFLIGDVNGRVDKMQ